MDISTLLSLVVTALITGIIAFIFWLLQRTIGDRITVKREKEKEKKRKEEEQYRKWLGPDGVPPKDEKEAVRIAKREGYLSEYGNRRSAKLPSGTTILLLFILLFIIINPFTQSYLSAVNDQATHTLLPSQTVTSIPSFTFTPSPKPIADYLYYMIVYDSSVNMNESFHGEKNWQVARNLLVEIMDGLNPRAKYNLAVIGGASSTGSSDPCNSPTSLSLPSFSSRQTAYEYLGELQPQGGGSFYKAYALAKNQFQNLPADTIKTLIFITGASDTCNTRDEWIDIQRAMSNPVSAPNIFTQIIILDDDGIKSEMLARQFESLTNENLNVQAPQSLSEIQSNGETLVHVVNNITTYVETSINRLATPTLAVTSSTPTTSTKTLTPTAAKTVTETTCQSISPYIDTASLNGSVWINTPAHCTTSIAAGEPIPVSGGYSNLPSDAVIWVFVYPPNGPFYPQSPNACASSPSPYPSQGGGGWSVPAYFGNLGDSSKYFDLVVMVTDQAGSDYIGQRLYEDCSGGFFDGISASDLASLNITTKATIIIKTK